MALIKGERRIGDWMQLASGFPFYPADPRASDIAIEDIAAALSKLCRFGGHCQRFYSVAEHSVLVSHVVPREYALQGLLHDATEAYVIDMPRPLKKMLPEYQRIEERVWACVAARFCLPMELHESVKVADDAVLLREKEVILGPSPMPWSVPGTPADVDIECWDPLIAEALFLSRFRELTA